MYMWVWRSGIFFQACKWISL